MSVSKTNPCMLYSVTYGIGMPDRGAMASSATPLAPPLLKIKNIFASAYSDAYFWNSKFLSFIIKVEEKVKGIFALEQSFFS